MKQLHVPNKVLTRSGGTHSWAYWEQDLHDTWPMIEADLNAKPAPAAKAAPKK